MPPRIVDAFDGNSARSETRISVSFAFERLNDFLETEMTVAIAASARSCRTRNEPVRPVLPIRVAIMTSLALFEQTREDSHQFPLLADGETSESGWWCGHAIEQKRAEPRTRWREIQHFDPAVPGRRAATYQTARLEAVHQPRHIRRVAGECLGELPHRHRPAGLNQVQ